VEKHFRIVYLLDLYANLLTSRQREVLSYHYNDDLSLSEIASLIGTTRQGAFDVLRRGEKLLEHYEDKLGLCRRMLQARETLQVLKANLNALPATQETHRLKTLAYRLEELL
jgi:predicted DNA-binding protein YlxM (UPF0122 family)